MATCLHVRAWITLRRGEALDSHALLQQAPVIYEQFNASSGIGAMRGLLGTLVFGRGENRQARPLYSQAGAEFWAAGAMGDVGVLADPARIPDADRERAR